LLLANLRFNSKQEKSMEMENTLFYGDNLDILRKHIPDKSVDLIYLDPPFNSKATYNILYSEKNGTASAAQIRAFEDTWHWDNKAEETYREITETAPQRVADLIVALRSFLGSNDMMAYLVMMAIRLVELQRVLKDTGSIYLHCDPTASHYLKLVMDAIFGFRNIRNEIIWQKIRIEKAQSNQFAKLHDIIFYYTKSEQYFFHRQRITPSQEYTDKYYTQVESGTGRRYQLVSFLQGGQGPPRRFGDRLLEPPPGKHWIWSQERIDQAMREGRLVFTDPNKPRLKRYLGEHKGRNVGSIWTDIYPINAVAKERLGYPTQKPETLLERIITASSNEGDIVLDPFCGCGTTITVAEKLKRKWIGIDITHLAISLMKHRLKDTFGDSLKYQVIGEPVDVKSAEELAEQDPYQFQWWALGLVGARPAESEKRKGGDRGIDGYVYFHDELQKTKKIILQVKCGHVNPSQIRDLRGVIERERAQIGVFITLKKPTGGMRKEAVSTGYYKSPGWNKSYPKTQILTIRELLEGKGIDYPPKTSITFKKAKRHEAEKGEQLSLDKEE